MRESSSSSVVTASDAPRSAAPLPGGASAGPVLLLCATWPEAAPLLRALGLPSTTAQEVVTPHWLLFTGGLGAHRVVAALHKAVRQHKPGRVVHFGFAGGLSPRLQPADLMTFTTLAEPSGRLISLEQPVPRVLSRQEAPPAGPRLLTVPYAVHRVADKQRLHHYHQSLAVDMESFPVASACAALGLRYTALRAVSDPADMALPPRVEKCLDLQGRIRPWGSAWFMLTHLRWLGVMKQLDRHSRAAGEALARKLVETNLLAVPGGA